MKQSIRSISVVILLELRSRIEKQAINQKYSETYINYIKWNRASSRRFSDDYSNNAARS
jgi:hypothetical protein